jgi:hypothetical protein
MNERIKQLAEQAGFNQMGIYNIIGIEEYHQKFAELIVRECIRHFNEDYQRDFDTLWREDLTNSIKKHFGVE